MTTKSRWKPEKPGDIHPKCGTAVVRKEGMFALPGHGRFSGLVCETCKALWNDPSDSFEAAAVERGKRRKAKGYPP